MPSHRVLIVPVDQQSLVRALTENMNEAMTSWVVAGHYELPFIVNRLVAQVPLLTDSTARDDGFAHSASARSDWICMDGEMGSGVFLFPRDETLFNSAMHGLVLALRPEFNIFPGIYGNLDPVVWQYIGGARVVAAQDFLSGN